MLELYEIKRDTSIIKTRSMLDMKIVKCPVKGVQNVFIYYREKGYAFCTKTFLCSMQMMLNYCLIYTCFMAFEKSMLIILGTTDFMYISLSGQSSVRVDSPQLYGLGGFHHVGF